MKPYYDDGKGIVIYHGDACDIVPSLHNIDLVVTDPPFYLPARIATSRKSWPRTLAELGIMNSFFRELFTALVKVLKRTGAFYTFSDSTSYAVFMSCCYPLFDRTQCIVWDKMAGGLGNGWRHSTELIVHGAFAETLYAPGFRRDLLECRTVPSSDREHPSEKPVPLVSKLIQAHPCGRVLDPFFGTGPVIFAAKSLGWQAVGIDVDEAWCEIATRRLCQEVLPFEVPTHA